MSCEERPEIDDGAIDGAGGEHNWLKIGVVSTAGTLANNLPGEPGCLPG